MERTEFFKESVTSVGGLKNSRALGTHIIAEFKGCSFEALDNEKFVKEVITEACKRAKMTILNVSTIKFEPHGMSGVVFLAESHLSIHTWPEHGYAAIDVFTCGEESDPHIALNYLKEKLKPKEVDQKEMLRGVLEELQKD